MPHNDHFKPSRPKETRNGIKARNQRGAFAQSWWAQRWISALERLVDTGRLIRGRNYARKGQVLSIEETKEGIEAKVQGSRRLPYKIKIQIATLSDAQWDMVIDALAEQAIFTAQLLAGEMPREIESAFEVANVSLFPTRRDDLITDCSCPDYSNPCKHIAAAHYILGERFDEDPFLIFRLRGRTQEQVMAGLRLRRAGNAKMGEDETAKAEIILSLEEQMAHFWELSASLDGFSVSIRPPTIGGTEFCPQPARVGITSAECIPDHQ